MQSHGAEADKGFSKNYETTRALINAAKIGNIHIIDTLINMGVNPNYEYNQQRYDAAQEGQYETVWYHEARYGAAFGGITAPSEGPLTSREELYTDKRHRTPLIFAAMYGHLHVVESLLAHGADKIKLDRDNMSALDYAEKNGHSEIVACLFHLLTL